MKKFVLLTTLLLGASTLASTMVTLPLSMSTQTVLTQSDAGPPDAGEATLDLVPPVLPQLDGDIARESAPLLKQLLDAVTSKNWVLLAAMAVSLLVLLLRWSSKKFGVLPFFTTDRGGVVLTFTLAFAGGFANAVAVGGASAVSLDLLLQCVMVATYAIGGFVGAKKFFFPSDLAK